MSLILCNPQVREALMAPDGTVMYRGYKRKVSQRFAHVLNYSDDNLSCLKLPSLSVGPSVVKLQCDDSVW